jgi:hypothetical protein
MPEIVVDLLQAVDVDEGDHEGVPRSGAPGYLPLQGYEARAALQHTGQLVALEDLALLVRIAPLVSGDKAVPSRLPAVRGCGGAVQRRLLALGGGLVAKQGQASPLSEVEEPGGHLSFGGLGLAVAFVSLAVAFVSLAVAFVSLAVAFVSLAVAPVVGPEPQFGALAGRAAARAKHCKTIAHVSSSARTIGPPGSWADIHTGGRGAGRPAQTPIAQPP